MAERGWLGTSMLVYCICNIVIALGVICCASWMHASQDVYAYLTVFVRSQNDDAMVAAAALLLVSGIILLLVSVLGVFGVLKEHFIMMLSHMLLLGLVSLLCIIAGFMTVSFYYDIHKYVKPAMQQQLEEYYQWESHVGMAWNRVQVKKRCCGADGSWDYETTGWYHERNPADEEPTVLVPDSCCALNFNQERELYWVNPQELQLKDAQRCQEDAAGRTGTSANLHQKGCFAALFQVNSDLWHDVDIFTVITCIEALSLTVGFLQWFGMALNYVYIESLRKAAQPKTMKY